MPTFWLVLILCALSAAGYVLGRRRALASAGGVARRIALAKGMACDHPLPQRAEVREGQHGRVHDLQIGTVRTAALEDELRGERIDLEHNALRVAQPRSLVAGFITARVLLRVVRRVIIAILIDQL